MTALRPGRQRARATELVCWSGGTALDGLCNAPRLARTRLDSSSATVSCASETACVAIVEQATYANSDSSGRFTWFADVWNGESWSTGRAPEASSISCVPGLCAAIGDGRTAILDRGRWHIVRAPHSPEFQPGLSCASTSMCVGVGAVPPPGPSQSGALVTTPAGIRWNGSRWFEATPMPEAGSQPSELHGVACASAHACVAVGAIYSNTSTRPLAEIWGGRGWRLANPPMPPGGGVLESVLCVSPDVCVAVGYTLAGMPNGLGQGTLVDVWNGSSWSAQTTPPVAGQVELRSVSCTSPSDCVAVGMQNPSPLDYRSFSRLSNDGTEPPGRSTEKPRSPRRHHVRR